jgi:hypothetical protein
MSNNFLQGGLAGLDEFPGQYIRIDNGNTMLSEKIADSRFATGNASGQTNHQHNYKLNQAL